jgi:Clp amino terminal domain, pathogenicity island component
MFEKFTNRARHVVVLSQEEARLLNHNYIGTEHILLGLLGEPESIGGQVLASFGLTLDEVRAEVESKIGRGKSQPTGHIPFTPRAKKILELSLREALAIKHNYIGTEHILLGLIREGEGVAAQIMREHADLAQIRAAVLEAVSAVYADEPPEGSEETNAVLSWLRRRLTRHGTSVPFNPDIASGIEGPTRGTPAVEAALQQAARLAGPVPVGSHHLLLAALEDANSAASWALASLGVDLDELRGKLRSAKITGTSDEPPEQAGRRQMAIQVTGETLTIVATDPVIVEAGKEALRAVNARAASTPGGAAGQSSPGAETAGGADEGEDVATAAAGVDSPGTEAGTATGRATATSTVIRGDNPHAAGLANVWLELRETLTTLADPARPARRTKIAVPLHAKPSPADIARPVGPSPAEAGKPEEPEEPGA